MGGGANYHQNDMLPTPTSTQSYWRTELHWIDDYQSSPQLPECCDIAIIGSGLSGAATAYHLLNQDWAGTIPSIVILEARQACSGATGRNGGHVKYSPSSLGERVKAMGRETVEECQAFVQRQVLAIKALIEKEGIECESELRRSYDVLIDQGEADKSYEVIRRLRSEGMKSLEVLDLVDPRFVEKVTSVNHAKGAVSTTVLSLWPYKLVTSLLEIVVKRGVQLHCHTPVLNIDQDHGDNVLRTPRGIIRAKKLIVASNGYTAGLLPQYRGTIVPYKGICSHISVPEGKYAPYLGTTYNIRYAPNRVDYMNPRPDGSIVIGGGQWTFRDDRSVWYDTVDDSTLMPNAKEEHFDGLMQRHFRGWENSGAFTQHLWTGIQAATTDELPHIGRVPGTENQYILAGYNGGGMAFIVLCAEGIAKMIAQNAPYEETGLPHVFKTTAARVEKKQAAAKAVAIDYGEVEKP